VITSTNLFELWMDHLKKQGRCRCKKP
jgi:hypothetical protein